MTVCTESKLVHRGAPLYPIVSDASTRNRLPVLSYIPPLNSVAECLPFISEDKLEVTGSIPVGGCFFGTSRKKKKICVQVFDFISARKIVTASLAQRKSARLRSDVSRDRNP